MNWHHIEVSADNTHFLYEGKPVFEQKFTEVLKFHAPGLAPVMDKAGAYHIDITGNAIYKDRYARTFGFYCNRAAVIREGKWFHINSNGKQAYAHRFLWTGNFQEDLCPVRDCENNYFHISLDGMRIYQLDHFYCGDFKDGIACVKARDGLYRHINTEGSFINRESYLDLGVFHKNFATARDKDGWFHIDKSGKEIYSQRYLAVEPFYNGYALATDFALSKSIIDESGYPVLHV